MERETQRFMERPLITRPPLSFARRVGWWGCRWLLNGAYLFVLLLLSPMLCWRVLIQRKPISGWWEKFTGNVGPLRDVTAIDIKNSRYWFHAVSVGEVLLLKPVLAELQRRCPDVSIVLSTTTRTGRDVARKTFPELPCVWFPWDFSWSVTRAIKSLRPTHIVLVELELWPNLILAAHGLGIPLSLINGRLGEKSFRGYRWLRPFVRPLLHCFENIAVQSAAMAERFLALGAGPRMVQVTGSVKFDGLSSDRQHPDVLRLRNELGIASDERVFIAGSTQDQEEAIALRVWELLRDEFPRLRLIVVPRHAERFDDVARMIVDRGHKLWRRSTARVETSLVGHTDVRESLPIILLDTLGELSRCWGLAEIAFVGGSLGRQRGGQNMLEPCAYGAAVLFGPHTENFTDIVTPLLQTGGAIVVQDEADLHQQVTRLLSDPAARKTLSTSAQQFLQAHQGATIRTINLLCGTAQPVQ
ncbi:MAG: 3-deoxy-D-manno-octulosonic acid transferase [Planctomycetaceae bacterium]